jgi:hypothetical protein
VQADCYQIRDAEGNISDVCFSAEGYLLATNEPDGTGLEATSVSGDVSDADGNNGNPAKRKGGHASRMAPSRFRVWLPLARITAQGRRSAPRDQPSPALLR